MVDGTQIHDCAIYHGEDRHAIDAKGRVNIPARHRRVASRKGSIEFWFAPGFDGCISLWDAQGFNEYSARISSLPTNVDDARRLRRAIFTRAARVEPDSQGRVVIPEPLRREIGLEGSVTILGVQDHLELWKPESYAAYARGSDEGPSRSLGEIADRLVF